MALRIAQPIRLGLEQRIVDPAGGNTVLSCGLIRSAHSRPSRARIWPSSTLTRACTGWRRRMDMQQHIAMTPPSVHQMVLTSNAGLIRKQPATFPSMAPIHFCNSDSPPAACGLCHCTAGVKSKCTTSRNTRVGTGFRHDRPSGMFGSGKCSRMRYHSESSR
jgi:hypothetical protein